MTLTNYWWLLIWLFFGGALASYLPKHQESVNGKSEKRWSVTAAILMILPYIIWAGTRKSFGDRLWDNYEQNADILMNKRESRRKQRSFLLFLFPHRIRDTIRGSRPSGRLPLFSNGRLA